MVSRYFTVQFPDDICCGVFFFLCLFAMCESSLVRNMIGFAFCKLDLTFYFLLLFLFLFYHLLFRTFFVDCLGFSTYVVINSANEGRVFFFLIHMPFIFCLKKP